MSRADPRQTGFTLVELLVVLAVLGILAALLLPALASARAAGQRAACVSNLRQMGVALHAYADDWNDRLPFGPKAPPFTNPGNFYPSTGAPTSLVSMWGGRPVGLGLLLDGYLGGEARVFFCPGTDQRQQTAAELARAGTSQSQSSYYYRHGENTRLFDEPNEPVPVSAPRWSQPGANRQGHPRRVLAMDSQFLVPEDLAVFDVTPRTHHQRRASNLLRWDGSAVSLPNTGDRFTVDVRNYSELRNTFSRILEAFEQADQVR
ncbi:MAG: DUF1559 domain-containing protein [Verrucomicrobia bacterium]|nr:MAG: DUF1559 domain-containing protein [Verrucomicrobiota bacterium]